MPLRSKATTIQDVATLAGVSPATVSKVLNHAPHVRGMAMDLSTGGKGPYKPSEAHKWLTKGGNGKLQPQPGEKLRAHAYGWRRTVPSERWHFGYSRAGDTEVSEPSVARAPQAAKAVVMADTGMAAAMGTTVAEDAALQSLLSDDAPAMPACPG